MQKYLPAPRLSLLLVLIWLCLNGVIQPLTVLGGLCVGFALPLVWRSWLPVSLPRLRVLPACALFALFIKDIIFANAQMAQYIALFSTRAGASLSPQLIAVPLATHHAWVNAILANMISLTPSTLTADIDEANAILWVHAVDCVDPANMVTEIKNRYETRLCYIFGVDCWASPDVEEQGT